MKKLNDKQITGIRKLRKQNWTLLSIARMYGVEESHISRVVRGFVRVKSL